MPSSVDSAQILIIGPETPWPVINGWRSRHFQLIRAATTFAACDVICLSKGATETDDSVRAELGVRSFKSIPIATRSRVLSGIMSVIAGKPMGYFLFRSRHARKRLKELQRDKDYQKALILGDVCMAGYAADISARHVVVDMCDDLAGNYLRRVKNATLFTSFYYRFQASAVRRFIGHFSQNVAVVMAVSSIDRKGLTDIVRLPVAAVPIGVDVLRYSPSDSASGGSGKRLLFVGAMRYWPNRDASEWFCDAILPLLVRQRPDISFHIVGSHTAEINATGPAIIKHGFVEDLVAEYRLCDIFVCPLRAGTGVKNKMLEAMASGCAIVSTSIGVEGLDVTHGKHLLIADSAIAFAEAVLSLTQDELARRRMGGEVRHFAMRELSLTTVRERLEEVFA